MENEMVTENGGFLSFEPYESGVEIVDITSRHRRVGSIEVEYSDLPALISALQKMVNTKTD